VTESTPPAGWTLKNLDCTATGQGTSVTKDAATASITMAGGGTVECTYTNHSNLSPTITTKLSAETITVGGTVHDSATLSGATANAGGTVTYGVVPDSDPITFNTAGDYYWQAVYSGDANNNAATSLCTSEHLVVGKQNTAMTTAQNLIPNDDANLSGATSTAGGTITFELFTPNAATCSGTPRTPRRSTSADPGPTPRPHDLHRQHRGNLALEGELQRRRQ
jgi:hypothetical protein